MKIEIVNNSKNYIHSASSHMNKMSLLLMVNTIEKWVRPSINHTLPTNSDVDNDEYMKSITVCYTNDNGVTLGYVVFTAETEDEIKRIKYHYFEQLEKSEMTYIFVPECVYE